MKHIKKLTKARKSLQIIYICMAGFELLTLTILYMIDKRYLGFVIVVFLLFVGLGIVILCPQRLRKPTRELLNTMSEDEKLALDSEFDKGIKLNRAILTDKYVLIEGGYLLSISDLVWIYKNPQGRPILTVAARKHSIYSIMLGKMNNSGEEKAFIEKIINARPSIVQGYSLENQRMYKENFNLMVEIADGRKVL